MNRDQVMDLVRARLYEVAGDPDDMKILAERARKSTSCLYSIRSGRTAWPRHETLFSLLPLLGLELVVQRSSVLRTKEKLERIFARAETRAH